MDLAPGYTVEIVVRYLRRLTLASSQRSEAYSQQVESALLAELVLPVEWESLRQD